MKHATLSCFAVLSCVIAFGAEVGCSGAGDAGPSPSSGGAAGSDGAGAGASSSSGGSSSGGSSSSGSSSGGSGGSGGSSGSASDAGDGGALSAGPATAISGTDAHTCVLTQDGGVRCWGENTYGELGNGATASSLVPTSAASLGAGVASIAAGYHHTCALLSGGGVSCWGNNGNGGLGNGTWVDSRVPVPASAVPTTMTALAAGAGFTCGLTTGGGVKCWGFNGHGQLGNGGTTSSTGAVDVVGLASGVTAITAGYEHACALLAGGGVKCWGDGNQGELGVAPSLLAGPGSLARVPVDVVGLASGVAAISAGFDFTCALSLTGGVKCWGGNFNGQLGNGTTSETSGGFSNPTPAPADVIGLSSGVSAISAGHDHTCAVTVGGGVKCWGGNDEGQIGNNAHDDVYAPVDVVGLSSGITALASGIHSTCALKSAGGVVCWGRNSEGELGNGALASSRVPVGVVGYP